MSTLPIRQPRFEIEGESFPVVVLERSIDGHTRVKIDGERKQSWLSKSAKLWTTETVWMPMYVVGLDDYGYVDLVLDLVARSTA